MCEPTRSSWRATVLQVFKGCISDVLVYREADCRRGIASALYRLIKAERSQSCARAGSAARPGVHFGLPGANTARKEGRSRHTGWCVRCQIS
jgi:hypothetical protein